MLKKLTAAQQAWVDALRSGQYKQTTMTLQDGDAFCCLGVACKVAEQHGIAADYDADGELDGDNLIAQPAKDWLGLITSWA